MSNKVNKGISFYTIQSRLKNLVETKNKMNGNSDYKASDKINKDFSLNFNNFDWNKYANV